MGACLAFEEDGKGMDKSEAEKLVADLVGAAHDAGFYLAFLDDKYADKNDAAIEKRQVLRQKIVNLLCTAAPSEKVNVVSVQKQDALPFEILVVECLEKGHFAICMPDGKHFLYAILSGGVRLLGTGRADGWPGAAVVPPGRALLMAKAENTRRLVIEQEV